MGKSLIITEKPSVAQEYAKILKVSDRKNGYIENDQYVITWCVGHLVEMVYPEEYDSKYKKWVLEDLPFLPQNYKYGVIKNVSGQYEIVHGMLHRDDIDRVYWAGDSGKEGQTIEENIRNFGGVREGMEELRVWIDSQTEEEILRGIREAKPMSAYANLGRSGIMRSIEDYAMGINFSRVMSVKYGKLLNDAAATKSYTAIAVGRVMTCVLGMVVIREREIRNFKETVFYRVVGSFTDGEIEAEWKTTEQSRYYQSPLLYKENGFKEQESAQQLINELQGKQAVVKSVEKGVAKKRAPLLFNLAELQAECSKRFKISPDETLQVAQELYEKKLTTYPRTDARVLTTAVAKEIGRNINRIKDYGPTKTFAENILNNRWFGNIEKTQYTDDSKVTDHYAIIPTGQLSELQNLGELQKKVFDLIVRRFLSIFYPPAEYQTMKLVIGVEQESLFTSAKILKAPGYLEVMGKLPAAEQNRDENGNDSSDSDESNQNESENKKDNQKLLEIAQTLSNGDPVSTNGYVIKDGKTSPPKRYTSGSMILAMENAGQLIEDEELREQIKGSGIGTSATRAEIIQKLVRIGYLNLNKKTQIIMPERLGEMIFEVVYMTVPIMLNPKMTASWEKGLDGITQGTVNMDDYRAKLEEFIRKETLTIRDSDLTTQIAAQINQFTGKGSKGLAARKKLGVACPICGGDLVTTPFGYGCDNYKKDGTGCKFVIGSIAGKDLSEEECKQLITTGETEVLDGFVSKSKKKFSAALQMKKDEEGKINITFDFSKNQPQLIEGISCPVCGAPIELTPFGYTCQKHHEDKEACYFFIGKIADKSISVDELKQLFTTGKTDVLSGFKSKTKKKFNAALVLTTGEDGKKTVTFDFSQNQPEIVEGVKCPDCGGDILVKSFGYGCANYDQHNPDSCKFAIGKIAEKDLNVAQVKELLTDGHTQTIRGFKSKAGKKFDACIILDKDENGKHIVKFDFDHVEAKKVKDVVCPLCGGDIVQTPFGFGCAQYDKDNPESCRFSIGKMAGKDIPEAQVKELLTNGRTGTIRGFKSKAGKKFDARVALSKDENGKVTGLKFDFEDLDVPKIKDVKCPICGGDIVQTPFGYGCSKYNKEDENSCRFSIGKIAGVKLSEAQIKQLLIYKKTDVIKGFLSKNGSKFDAPLKLTSEGQITFDFPEKAAPVETSLKCPKCQKMMKKSQWYYECECGFKVSHTVAQVPLSEEVMQELFETGKTKAKIVGFKSKAGNVFDTCLKFEEDRISFDFDNQGESPAPGSDSISETSDSDAKLMDQISHTANAGAVLKEEPANFLDEFEQNEQKQNDTGSSSAGANEKETSIQPEMQGATEEDLWAADMMFHDMPEDEMGDMDLGAAMNLFEE